MTNEEFMILGKLSGQMEAVLGEQEKQSSSIGKIFDRLDKMPCKEHGSVLLELKNWKVDCNGNVQAEHLEHVKGSISLRNAVIGGIAIAIISNIPSIILILSKVPS